MMPITCMEDSSFWCCLSGEEWWFCQVSRQAGTPGTHHEPPRPPGPSRTEPSPRRIPARNDGNATAFSQSNLQSAAGHFKWSRRGDAAIVFSACPHSTVWYQIFKVETVHNVVTAELRQERAARLPAIGGSSVTQRQRQPSLWDPFGVPLESSSAHLHGSSVQRRATTLPNSASPFPSAPAQLSRSTAHPGIGKSGRIVAAIRSRILERAVSRKCTPVWAITERDAYPGRWTPERRRRQLSEANCTSRKLFAALAPRWLVRSALGGYRSPPRPQRAATAIRPVLTCND
jgi:hypothetical protein